MKQNPCRYKTLDKNGNVLFYLDTIKKYWERAIFDERNNRTFRINSDGYWERSTFDERNRVNVFLSGQI